MYFFLWLLPFYVIILRSIYVVEYVHGTFIFITDLSFIVWM